MIAKKEIIKKLIYSENNDKQMLIIVIAKYRRNFQNKYVNYDVAYFAYNKKAKTLNNKLKIGHTVRINYRIESEPFNTTYRTTLIVDDIKILDDNSGKLEFNDNDLIKERAINNIFK